MEIHQIRYFLAVADSLNFTRAAEMCNVSQPALTRAVKKLEDELGGSLLYRERSTTHMTELGRTMEPMLRKVFDGTQYIKQAASAFHDDGGTSVRLGVSQTIEPSLLATPLHELAKAIPRLQIKLVRTDVAEIATKLKEGEIDLAVAGMIDSKWDRLDSWVLFSEGYSILVPRGHDITETSGVSSENIDDLNLLQREFCEDSVVPKEPSKDQPAQSRHSVTTETDLISFVEAGIGAAISPNSLKIPASVVRVPFIDSYKTRCVKLYSVSGRQRSLAGATLIKLLRAIDWSNRVDTIKVG